MDNDTAFMDRAVSRMVPELVEVKTTPVSLYRRNGKYLETIGLPAPVDPAQVLADYPETYRVRVDALRLTFTRKQFSRFDGNG
ncbi:MAG TPA: hypothetical protein QGG18_03350 [Rhodospirillales bacterium]|nr:hypothetical protein [Rhodospirillales bacterium]